MSEYNATKPKKTQNTRESRLNYTLITKGPERIEASEAPKGEGNMWLYGGVPSTRRQFKYKLAGAINQLISLCTEVSTNIFFITDGIKSTTKWSKPGSLRSNFYQNLRGPLAGQHSASRVNSAATRVLHAVSLNLAQKQVIISAAICG